MEAFVIKTYFNFGSYFDFEGDVVPTGDISFEKLIPHTHIFLFKFLKYDLTKLEKALNTYFACFNSATLEISPFDKEKNTSKFFKVLNSIHPYYKYVAAHYFEFNMLVREQLNYLLHKNGHNNLDYKKYIGVLEQLSHFEFKFYDNETKEKWYEDYLNFNIDTFDGITSEYTQLQDELGRIIYWVFDFTVPELFALSIPQRASLYEKLFIGCYDSLLEIKKKYSFGNKQNSHSCAVLDFADEDVAIEVYNLNKTENALPVEVLSIISEIYKETDTPIREVCNVNSLRELLMFEIILLIENPVIIKKCKLCGNYFVAENLKNEYCSYISKGENRPCFEVGPTKIYQNRMKSDEAYVLYQRAYKTHYARFMKQKINQNQFNIWSLDAKNRLELVRNGKMDILDYAEWLKV